MRRCTVLLALMWLPPAVAGGQTPLGDEFRVPAVTTGKHSLPKVASDAAGNFVVVWQSYPQDGDIWGVYAQRYDASGAPVGGEFRVNEFTTGSQTNAAVAADPSGRFVVAFGSFRDGSYDIWARRFDAAGTPGAEFRVNSYTTGFQSGPSVAMDGGGIFVVVWSSPSPDPGAGYDIFAQRYDASGAAQGPQFRVNATTTGHQGPGAVAMDAAGNFVVVWTGPTDGDGYGVFGRRFAASSAPLSGDFVVNSYTTGSPYDAAVAMDASGSFFVAWNSPLQDGSSHGIFAQRYDATGTAVGGELRVNDHTLSGQRIPAVTRGGNGSFVVVWDGDSASDDSYGISGKRYLPAGSADGEFPINAFTTGPQMFPGVASDASGRFVVVWQDGGPADIDNEVFARRFAPDLIFGDGFDAGTLAAWSSAATGGGDLTVTAMAALDGTAAGLQGVVNDTAGLFVQDDSPLNEDRYRARFYFDPNGFDPGESVDHRRTRLFILFEDAPTRRVAALVLRRLGGAYSLMGRARLDDNSQANTAFFPIADGPHFVELDWRRSSGPVANDGSFQMWLDGVSVATLSNLDNSVSSVDFVRLGALSVKTAASGTLYWDEFESRRSGFIGP